MELLERDSDLANLRKWLSAIPVRGGCNVLIGGEAGVGKTALLHEFSKRQSAVRVLSGGCDDLFTPRPLSPLHDIARQAQGRLFTALGAGEKRDDIFSAALDELERTPTMMVVEDAHWADEATLDLLKYLGRRVQRTSSLLVISYRDDEVGPRHPLRAVIGEMPRASTHRQLLAPLSESAVAELARRAGRTAAGLHLITGGNPLFLTEVLAAATEAVPATVRDAVLARAARLTPAAREIAEQACVIPGKTEAWMLDDAARPDPDAVEECVRIGMVLSADGSLRFRHELVRRALEDSLPHRRRLDLHARVLGKLVARPGSPAASMAHHAACARDRDSVLKFAPLAAADAVAVGAHRQAAAHLDSMVEYAGEFAPKDRARLLEEVSYECFLTGRYARAKEVRLLALDIWRELRARVQEGETLSWLSRIAGYEGDLAEAYRYSEDALQVLETLPPDVALAKAYCHRADIDMESHANESAIEFSQRAAALAESAADAETLSKALNVLGTARLVLGDQNGWQDLERSLSLSLAGDFQEQAARAYVALAAMAVSRRWYDAASRHFEAGLDYCDQRDLDFLSHYLLGYRARMKFERGDWPGASEDALEVLSRQGVTSPTRIPVLRTLGHLRLRRGDPGAASALEEARILSGDHPVLQRMGTLAAINAEAAWLADDREGVINAVMPVYERLARVRDPRMKGELAAWLWRVGALAEAPTEIAEPYAMEITGNWQGAARAWQELGCPYEHALVIGRYGGETEQHLGLEIFEQLGAVPAAESLRRRMRSLGVRGIRRGARASTQEHPFGLTKREAQILGHIRDGHRNATIAKKLFLSTRTVDHHVSAILAKLGVTSRSEAIEIARQQPESTA